MLKLPMCKALVVIVVCLLLSVTIVDAKPKVALSKLRSHLSTALGTRASIVKDELNQPNNSARAGEYWLVHVKPKSTGHFAVKYRYNYNDKLYSHVERELRFRVGKTGCLRNPDGNGVYAKFCLGDTIILPIALENFTEHEFSLKFTDELVNDDSYADDRQPDKTLPPANPASANLIYLGAYSATQLHRAGGYTLQRYAVFEARQPGRFTLALSNLPLSQNLSASAGGYSIIVVDRETPITALLANENVEGFSKGFNGQEYSSSTGSNTNYLTNVIVIQTGDRFTFNYASEVHSAREEWNERAKKTFDKPTLSPPSIAKLPFSFDPTWEYNNWIKDWVTR
ncbi:MAG TPA: hypothetical protein VI306_10975 [Pyrinomonadaceae bacterium]